MLYPYSDELQTLVVFLALRTVVQYYIFQRIEVERQRKQVEKQYKLSRTFF